MNSYFEYFPQWFKRNSIKLGALKIVLYWKKTRTYHANWNNLKLIMKLL